MNINKLLKQAKKMQNEVIRKQEELEGKEYEASAGGGMVRVKVSGKFEIMKVTIDPQAVDPDDVEILQDMIVAAVNEAIRTARKESEEIMQSLAGGIPGLPGF